MLSDMRCFAESVDAIDLGGTLANDEDVARLSTRVPLRKLSLRMTDITDAALVIVSSLKQLNYLDLSQNERITDKGVWCSLANLNELETLLLDSTMITDASLRAIELMPKLRRLELDFTNISDDGLEIISQRTSLQQLSLFETKVSDEGVRFLASARLISELDLGSTAITDACISTILKMPLLEHLGLWGTRVSDIGLQQLAACRRLKYIEIGKTNTTEFGILGFRASFPSCFVQD